MPLVARLFIKTGIVYLVLAFVLGAVLLVREASGRTTPFIIGVEHSHMAFVGWLVNTVVGVALWLLPLNRRAFPTNQGRYPRFAAGGAYLMLNAGLALRLIIEPLHVSAATPVTRVLLVLAAVLQVAAIAVVGWIVWHRVFPPIRLRTD